MINKKILLTSIKAILFILPLLSCLEVLGQSKGSTSQKNIGAGDVRIREIWIRYSFNNFFGEMTRSAVFKWEGTGKISTFDWSAQVLDSSGRYGIPSRGEPVAVSWKAGTINPAGKGYGFDVSGSPDWNKAFFTFRKGDPLRNPVRWLSKDEAIKIYKDGFSLGHFQLRTINGNAVKYRSR